MVGGDGVSIREYIEGQLKDRDELCSARMSALTTHMFALLEGLEKRFETIITLMDRSVNKAEVAQREYNEKANNLRGVMDDAARLMIPRGEAQLEIRGLSDRLDRMQGDITSLRDFRSETGGRGTSRHETWGYAVGLVALLFSLASIVLLVVREIRFG